MKGVKGNNVPYSTRVLSYAINRYAELGASKYESETPIGHPSMSLVRKWLSDFKTEVGFQHDNVVAHLGQMRESLGERFESVCELFVMTLDEMTINDGITIDSKNQVHGIS